MIISRRIFLRAFASLFALPLLASPPAQASEKTVGIDCQKYGTLVHLKGKGLLEERLKKIGYTISWTELPTCPQTVKTLNVGAVDFGRAGAHRSPMPRMGPSVVGGEASLAQGYLGALRLIHDADHP